MKNQQVLRQAMKVSFVLMFTILLGIGLMWTFQAVATLPVVFKAMPGKVVGCASSHSDWKRVRASSPICQQVLRGQYEVEWVAP